MTIDKVCEYYAASRMQRATELRRGLGIEGTKGYEISGCYTCDGLDFSCSAYVNFNYEDSQEPWINET